MIRCNHIPTKKQCFILYKAHFIFSYSFYLLRIVPYYFYELKRSGEIGICYNLAYFFGMHLRVESLFRSYGRIHMYVTMDFILNFKHILK